MSFPNVMGKYIVQQKYRVHNKYRYKKINKYVRFQRHIDKMKEIYSTFFEFLLETPM